MSQIIKNNTITEIDMELRNENDIHNKFITERVGVKAKSIVNLIDCKYFKFLDYSYATSYHTYCIDFENNSNLLSLEIGFKSLGYFTEVNNESYKIIEEINIESDDEIKNAVEQINNDLYELFNPSF